MKIIKSYLLILILAFTGIFQIACDKADLETYKTRSGQFATATDEAVNLTRDLWQKQIISLDQKDRIADALVKLATGGETVHKFITDTIETHGENVPKNTLEEIKKLFRTNIVENFLDVLERLKILNLSAQYRTIITAIKTTVLLLADVLTVRNQTETALKGV